MQYCDQPLSDFFNLLKISQAPLQKGKIRLIRFTCLCDTLFAFSISILVDCVYVTFLSTLLLSSEAIQAVNTNFLYTSQRMDYVELKHIFIVGIEMHRVVYITEQDPSFIL